MDTKHPLLIEINAKMNVGLSEEEIEAMEEMADKYKREYLEHPKHRQIRQQAYEENDREAEKEDLKIREAWSKRKLMRHM